MRECFLSGAQTRLLEALRQFGALREDQLAWLYRLVEPDAKRGLAQVMGQLAYLSRARREGAYWCAAWRTPEPRMSDAFDVMRLLCGERLPQFVTSRGPCALTFTLPPSGEDDCRCFRLYFVKPGEETQTCAVASAAPPGHTVLYAVEALRQADALFCSHPYFVVLKEDGSFSFFQTEPRKEDQTI